MARSTRWYTESRAPGASDPIEKKPLFHFFPGSKAFSIATVGCNFRCLHCQNHDISQAAADEDRIEGFPTTPEQVVAHALDAECRSISYTYTEPTMFFEYAFDIARLAHEAGLYNNFVTNGYIEDEAAYRDKALSRCGKHRPEELFRRLLQEGVRRAA